MTFTPSKHPRGASGSGKGGEFVPLSYNAKSNTGSGYGRKGGSTRVSQIQQDLNRLGDTDRAGHRLAVDGKDGPLTTSAVKRFQRQHHLPATGVVNLATGGAIRKAAAAKTTAKPKAKTTTKAKTTAKPKTPRKGK
jgi:peptidoglycan hydrolase-like protein with peptidoglycan-binding domain